MNVVTPGSLEQAYKFTKPWEGGFVNHPKDPGGATNAGVTQKTYDAYRRKVQKPQQTVRAIADYELIEIYKQYWKDAMCERLISESLAIAHFDTAFNFGPERAARFLQSSLAKLSGHGLAIDGKLGPSTLGVLETFIRNNSRWAGEAIAMSICSLRMQHRFSVVGTKPGQSVFLKGWLARDLDLMNRCRVT